jgi:hypothetical protein
LDNALDKIEDARACVVALQFSSQDWVQENGFSSDQIQEGVFFSLGLVQEDVFFHSDWFKMAASSA